MQKVDMGIAIVCMINNTALKEMSSHDTFTNDTFNSISIMPNKPSNTTSYDTECQIIKSSNKKFDGPFVWTKKVQGFVLSAYFYGYILTQVTYLYLLMIE